MGTIEILEDGLADAYLELGRLDDAIAEYERALRLFPGIPLARYHLGQAYLRKGQADRASDRFRRFLDLWKDAAAFRSSWKRSVGRTNSRLLLTGGN